MVEDLVPVVLAGGSGTRLWPISRSAFPKHLVELTGTQSLLQGTARRLARLAPTSRITTIAAAGQAILVRRQLAEIDPALLEHLLLEPAPRNTAAAVALAALYVSEVWSPDRLIWVCPSDHLVLAPEVLEGALLRGLDAARHGRLVTFGIMPSRPETGFGWIAQADPIADSDGVFEVERFVEKPPLADAQAMLEDGRYQWNSGMFLMRPDSVLGELERFEPALLEACRKAFVDAGSARAEGIARDAFMAVPSAPIDKAVMERSDRVAVIPCDPRWSDVGSWHALWEILPKDEAGNVRTGDTVLADAHDNIVKAESRLVTLAGVRDLAVIETADAVLVADKKRSEGIKALVARLAGATRKEADVHAREVRPWGDFTVLHEGPGFMVREVVLNPRSALRWQEHQHRDEHWTVVEGQARVQHNGDLVSLAPGASTTVARGVKHQLRNDEDTVLRIIEVQIGEELGEADTRRFDG